MVAVLGRNPLASVVVVVIVEVGNLKGLPAGVIGDVDRALKVAGPFADLTSIIEELEVKVIEITLDHAPSGAVVTLKLQVSVDNAGQGGHKGVEESGKLHVVG